MTRGGALTFLVAAAVALAYAVMSVEFEAPTETVQISWTCLGLAGGIVTVANLADSWIDLKVLRESGKNGELEILAKAGIRQDSIRLFQMVLVIGVGLVSLATGPTLTQEQRDALDIPTWTTISIALTAGIAGVVVCAVVQAVLDRRARLVFYSKQGVRRSTRDARPDA